MANSRGTDGGERRANIVEINKNKQRQVRRAAFQWLFHTQLLYFFALLVYLERGFKIKLSEKCPFEN